ncbi:Ku80 [Coprinopsis cinerea AmutBmut pab1-1]|nr:Ku80 [Coprinopsis cinerea AmutBmut pab1-1]
MPAERAGYTVSMFLVDVSSTMAEKRAIELPPGPDGEPRTTEITNLEWALRYVKYKVQEMIFHGRKTDQCGVYLFGSEVTDNLVNKKQDGYDHIQEYIKIGTPNIGTLAKIDEITTSDLSGDPLDALVVGIEAQKLYLGNKKTWTRKIFLITDGERPIEIEDWQDIVNSMLTNDVRLTVVGIDFDDEEGGYVYPEKSFHKKANEDFFKEFVDAMGDNGVLGTLEFALQEVVRPEPKQVKSTPVPTVLRIGDPDYKPDEAMTITVRATKCTALVRPASLKKYALREITEEDMAVDEDEERKAIFKQLKMRTEYYVDRNAGGDDEDENVKMEDDEDEGLLLEGSAGPVEKKNKEENWERIEKEELVKGFKYGTTYAPCPDGQFPKLQTVKGIDIMGFFPSKNFRRELSMGEVTYIWPGTNAPDQLALSSLIQAMYNSQKYAIARWVLRDNSDPKMGVLAPCVWDNIDCLLWVRMPFADDVRKYVFGSLDTLVNKKGEVVEEHPYLPTQEQQEAMDNWVDKMELGDAGDKDEEGNRMPWFDTSSSFNPAVHRIKQAIFHSAVVSDVTTDPLPPPHPELLTYFEPPKRVLKRSRDALEECKKVFAVKEVPKRTAKSKKDEHTHGLEEEDSILLLDAKKPAPPSRSQTLVQAESSSNVYAKGEPSTPHKKVEKKKPAANDDDSVTEDESGEEDYVLLDAKPKNAPLPTPARSVSPAPRSKGKQPSSSKSRDGDEDDEDAMDIDTGRAPGRIISSTYPLRDFKKNISQGDVVSKAVEDLGEVIKEVVMKPFTKRREDEMVECMRVLRGTCREEDEIDAWNAFITDLKKKCLSKPGNPKFWAKVQEVGGKELGLIGEKEAKRFGGTSQYTERQVEEFMA